MISKLEQLKAFLRKEGGGDGGGGGGDGGGGFSGTVSTVESSGFVPTYGGGSKKKKSKKKVTKGPVERFAGELLDFAIKESEKLAKATDMRNTALGQSSPSGDNDKYTRHADIGRNNNNRVISPPEIPLQHDAILNWEELFQKSEMVDLQITAKVLIRDESGKLLILKDKHSDWWDLPGGHIREDETPEEGALREVEEETGLKLNDAFLVMGAEVDTDIGHKLALFLVSYIPVEAPKPLISEEHTDFAWVRLEDSRYYNLGVWAPIVEYFMGDFQNKNLESLENPQDAVLKKFKKSVVVNTEDNGDKTVLTADGVYLVKSNGTLFKQEPSEEARLEKDRVYIKPGEPSPEGVKVETGPSGGKFYDAEVSPGMAELDSSDRPKTTDDLKYEGLDTPSRHPDRVPGGTTEWDRLMNYEIDSEGNGYGERTLKAIGMDSEEWDDKFASQWVTDSDDEQYGEAWISNSLEGHAVALQYAASDIFSSDKSRIDKMAKHFRTDMLTDDEVHGDRARRQATEYLRDTYANTQRSFEERGIKELELYRGVKTGGQAGVKAGQRVGMKDLPLSSWTADPSTANGFGDTVVSRKFDVRDIVMSMMDKMPSSEFEFVVHTPDQGFESTVQYVSYSDQR